MVMLRINSLLSILLLFTLRSTYGISNVRRQIVEENVRGRPFGVETFLVQQHVDEAKPDKEVVKRVRPIANHKPTLHDSGHTYGLENFSVGAYDLNNFQPLLVDAKFHARRIPGATKQAEKIPVINETPLRNNANLEAFSRSSPPPETVTEKTKKRIMLRKRRRRPSNSTQAERGKDFTENRAPSLSKIIVAPAVPKVTLRNNIPLDDGTLNKNSFEMPFQPVIKKEIITETQGTTEIIEQPPSRKTRTTTQQPPSINLKMFLKQQTETLSLSELLQTRNLSLADLLKGNRDASEILRGQQQFSTAAPSPSVRRKVYHKVESTTEDFERFDKISEHIRKENAVEVSAPRPNRNRHSQKIQKIKFDEQSSNTQESQQNVKNDVEGSSTTTKKPSFDPRSRVNELRLKLRNFQRRTQTASLPLEITSPIPIKETIISLLPFSFSTVTSSTESPNKNKISSKNTNNSESVLTSTETIPSWRNIRPDRVSNFLKRLPSIKKFGKEKVRPSENLMKKPIKIHISENENNTKESFAENISEEAKKLTTQEPSNELNTTPEETQKSEGNVEEKDDLLELLKSELNASKLQKILNARNMTLQEVLENREKPTVQSNIAELFANHQKEVSYSTQSSQAFDDGLPDFMEISKRSKELSLKTMHPEEPYAEESMTTVTKIQSPAFREPKLFDNFITNEKEELRLNLQPNDLTKEKSKVEISAVWNLSENPNLQEPSYTFRDKMQLDDVITEQENPNVQLYNSEIKLFEDNLRKLKVNQKFRQDTKDQNFDEEPTTEDIGKAYIPPAVKSAIFASGVVMGIALFVFIAIFAACGWKQRQIRLKNSASILGDTLNKHENKARSGNTLSPDSFKGEKKLKKAIDFDDDSSDSGSSATGSYLWNTLKNTFTNRTSTLKNRLEKQDKIKGAKMTLGRFESRRVMDNRRDNRSNTFHIQTDRFQSKKIDRDQNVISTSFNFRRSLSPNGIDDFSECPHGF